MIDDCTGHGKGRVARGFTIAQSRARGSATSEAGDRTVGVSILIAVTTRPAPRSQMHAKLGVGAADVDPGARLELLDGVFDDDVRALVEAEVTEVDERAQGR